MAIETYLFAIAICSIGVFGVFCDISSTLKKIRIALEGNQ